MLAELVVLDLRESLDDPNALVDSKRSCLPTFEVELVRKSVGKNNAVPLLFKICLLLQNTLKLLEASYAI